MNRMDFMRYWTINGFGLIFFFFWVGGREVEGWEGGGGGGLEGG